MRILLLMCSLMLASCAVSQTPSDVKATEPAETNAVEAKPVASKPAEAKPIASTPGAVDVSCKTDSDCKIKDVGSCCGYRPACVNKNSATYPEEVKAQCSKEGRMGICGFPSISSCTCTNNKCEGVQGEMSEENIQ